MSGYVVSESDGAGCPLPAGQYERIVMAHGGGGRLMQQLLDRMVRPAFDNPYLAEGHDSAVIEFGDRQLAFTSDSFVVSPLFFPGGDIGKLAVCGTLNDLAMAGARPLYMSAALIIEEGLALCDLQRVLDSMAVTARAAGVSVVTGDTKVVERGKGDGLYINTAGIGVVNTGWPRIQPGRVQPGDVILVNGDLGRHGMAIMMHREGIDLESRIESDCADLSGLVLQLLDAGVDIHCLRDLTRGGLVSALVEIAEAVGLDLVLEEPAIPVREDVMGACELLGFDPLYVANEGRMVIFIPEAEVGRTLAMLDSHPLGQSAAVIGRVSGSPSGGRVTARGAFGVERTLIRLSGDQLPRIC